MGKYSIIKNEFSFLESKYGFAAFMRQKHGSYYYVTWSNGKKDIMVLYDDQANEQEESPVWIRIYDADCFGTAYDDVDEFRKEFYLSHASPKERIRYAARWLRAAINTRIVLIE